MKDTFQNIYEDCTLKQLGNNPQGTRMDVVFMAMQKAYELGINNNIEQVKQMICEKLDEGNLIEEKVKERLGQYSDRDDNIVGMICNILYIELSNKEIKDK